MSSIATNKPAGFWKRLSTQRQLVLMSVPIILYVILFTYVPLAG